MKRALVSLVVLLILPLCHTSAQSAGAAGQRPTTPATVPGSPTAGAPRPGLPPPRDNAQSAQQTGTAKVRGRVTAVDTGAPLRRVQMALSATDIPNYRRTTQTDAQGRYEFVDLPAGKFSLNASKAGYVGLQYGQRRPYEAGTPIALAEGETATPIDFVLPRGSVISVRLTDEFGEALAQAQVSAQRFQYTPDGQRRLTPARTGTTDDRGELRLFGLMPGEYVVEGSVRNATVSVIGGVVNPSDSTDGYPSMYYPGTPNAAEAQPVSLGIGEEIHVQFSLQPARMTRISGTVRDSGGRPVAGSELIMTPRVAGGLGFAISGGLSINRTLPDGSFTIGSVAPGEYTIDVRQLANPTSSFESASVPVSVGTADITGLRITTSKGSVVSGRVIWNGTAARTNPLPISPRVTAQSVDAALALGFGSDPKADGTLDDDGNFQLGGVSGRIFLAMPVPPAWTLKSVTLDGEDITDVPLDIAGRTSIEGVRITLTDKLTHLTGQVTDASGKPLAQYVAVLLPADEKEPTVASRFIRVARPDTNGRFDVRNIRPGRYVVTAVESLEQGRQFAPEFQRELRRGAYEFTVKEGETRSLDLKLRTGL